MAATSSHSQGAHPGGHVHGQLHEREQQQGDINSSSSCCSCDDDGTDVVRRVLRGSYAAEVAAVGFFRGQSLARCGRIDVDSFLQQERGALHAVGELLPKYRVRPSLVQGALGVAAAALGAAAAVAPRRLGLAVMGALADALTEHSNEQLRQLAERQGGLEAKQQVADVRAAVRMVRDLPRAPEGAPPAPDIVAIAQAAMGGSAGSGGDASTAPGGSDGSSSEGLGVGEHPGLRGTQTLQQVLRAVGVDGAAAAVVKAAVRAGLQVADRV